MMRAGLFGGDWEDYHNALQDAVEKEFWNSQPAQDGPTLIPLPLYDGNEGVTPGDLDDHFPSGAAGRLPITRAQYKPWVAVPLAEPNDASATGIAATPANFAAPPKGMDVAGAGPAGQGAKAFVRLPQPSEMEAGESGGGYGTYGTPGNGAGQYGTEKTMQVITSASNALANGSQYTPFSVGNISLENGAPFPGHKGHMDGLGIDIRPARKDGSNHPVTWQSSDYDPAATQRIVDALHKTGQVSTIYFNDPNIRGVTPWKGHDNHIHAQVNP